MSADNRSSSALFKRAEQLKRWEESETNKESGVPGNKPKKIQFSLGCVFLAACASGDKDEVLKLLEVGADIDTTNVDGLSALHQACIDDNLDMVEFLVEHGADINKGDNEGWTPLHATASCGFISIAKYLIEQGADIAAVNNDGELAVDIAESDEMEDMLQQVLTERGIDCDGARNEEERLMLSDAQKWLKNCMMKDIPHSKTGATALHVSAAKGYIKVMETLIQAGANTNVQDYDGWTPLHAAAHWGQKEACEILVENFCDMDVKNYVGQTAFDIADPDIVHLLEELRDKQKHLLKERTENYNVPRTPEVLLSPKKRNLITDKFSPSREKNVDLDRATLDDDYIIIEEETVFSDNVPKPEPETPLKTTDNDVTKDRQPIINDVVRNYNDEKHRSPSLPDNLNKVPNTTVPIATVKEHNNKENEDVTVSLWRRPASFKGVRNLSSKFDDKSSETNLVGNNEDKSQEVGLRRTQSFESDEKFYRRYCELRAKIDAASNNAMPFNSAGLSSPSPRTREKLRRNFAKEDLKLSLNVTVAPTDAVSSIAVSSSPSSIASSASSTLAASVTRASLTTSSTIAITTAGPSTVTSTVNSVTTSTSAASAQDNASKDNLIGSRSKMNYFTKDSGTSQISMSAPTTPNSSSSKLSPGNIFKNFFKSFVPPVRDEESETQRKAHAKRVRETRRSTQGVTLEDIKWAEQLVKKKQQQLLQVAQPINTNNEGANNNTSGINLTDNSTNEQSGKFENRRTPTSAGISVSATITTSSINNINSHTSGVAVPFYNKDNNERRPSWRLKLDNGSKFMLEDARKDNIIGRGDSSVSADHISHRRSSATNSQPAPEVVDTTTVTLPLRKLSKSTSDENNDQEKDDLQDNKNMLAAQAMLQRRRRPKRRSTGVVQLDADDTDIDKDETINADNSNNVDGAASGTDRKSYRSHRLSSSSLTLENENSNRVSTGENGEIDYKKLYEETLLENERLKEKVRTIEGNMVETNSHYSNSFASNNKYSLSELEKRERRAMERKLSEMEEELKQLQKLKSENERLRAENRALTRVVSKLTTSANAVK